MILHIDLEFSRGAPAPPAVVRIPQAEIVLGSCETQPASGQKLDVQETEEQSAQMREIGDPALRWIEDGEDRDRDPDADQVFGLDPERQREHEHFLIGVQNPKGHQQPENTPRRSDGALPLIHSEEMGVGHANRHQSRAHNAKRVALNEATRSPVLLEIGTDEPKREHVEKQVPEVGVQQGIGDDLPDFAVHDIQRDQRKPFINGSKADSEHPVQDLLGKENSRTCQNDALHPSCKGRKAERDGLSARHCFYLSGSDTTGRLRCPAASTARTPNITLSFETFRVARVPLLTIWTYSQSAALVERQTTS